MRLSDLQKIDIEQLATKEATTRGYGDGSYHVDNLPEVLQMSIAVSLKRIANTLEESRLGNRR